MYQVTASLVTYNNPPKMLERAINSFLASDLSIHLYISDNSPTDRLRKVFSGYENLSYIYNNDNLGFGKGHNIAIKKAIPLSKYHLILNPDVYFDEKLIANLFHYMEMKQDIGLVAPKILYPDLSIQNSARPLPNLLEQILRRIPYLSYHASNYKPEKEIQEPTIIPFLLGCFLFTRTSMLEEIGGFDERFFMYMEDVDLCRRIGRIAKTVYHPNYHAFHIYEKGSSKSMKLLMMHITSMIKYYDKWGWFFDKERKLTNSSSFVSERLTK